MHNAILTILKAHYEAPFPSACMDAKRAVEALYPTLQGCQADADCEYSIASSGGENAYYIPISAADVQAQVYLIPTRTQFLVRPMVVANTKSFDDTTNATNLTAAYELAQKTCTTEDAKLWNSGKVEDQVELNYNGVLPTCVQNMCMAHSDAPAATTPAAPTETTPTVTAPAAPVTTTPAMPQATAAN